MTRSLLLALVVLLIASVAHAQTTQPFNLVTNTSLEEVGENNLPKDWRTVSTWGPKGKFALDETEHHGGQRSIQIISEQSSQNYLATDMIPVSPGETFFCAGWVKTEDVKVGENGKVQIQGVFAREDGEDTGVTVAALKLSPDGTNEWTHVEGNFKIPVQSTKAWVRFGMHDASGTCWWDDVEIHPYYLVAARIDVKAQRVSPSDGGLAVTVINRDKRRGTIELQAQVGREIGKTTVELTGEPTQSALVPMQLAKPGVLDGTLTVFDSSHRELYTQKRKIPVPPPIAVMPPIPTHWVKEDGPASISGEVDLAIADEKRNGATLSLDLLNSTTHGKPLHHLTWSGSLKDGWNHWQMNAGDLPIGDYVLVATLKPKTGEPITDAQEWHVINRADAKVIVNSNGYLEYKGKPIFPLGIFNSGGHTKELAASGFTVTHAYNAMNVVADEPAPDLRPQVFLDETQKNGMMCLFLVPRGFVFKGDWDGVRRRIRMFKNHPALLAWDEEEGLARGQMKPPDLDKLVQIIREEDPNHPIMIGDARDGIRKVTDRSNFFPVPDMDLGMWWWYPLPLGAGNPSVLNGEEAAKGLELAPPSFLTLRNTDKPIWVGVQSYKKPSSWGRFPTPLEYRAQAYISMIHGAKGLMWYGGGVEGGIYGKLEEGHWDDVKSLVSELHEMSPAFMSPTGDAPKFAPADAPLSAMLKTMPDRTVLLTANRGSQPVDVTFDVKASGHAKVLYEKREVEVKDGKLTDHFEPYVVHVYELTRR